MNYIVIDTCIIIYLLRNNARGKIIAEAIEHQDDPTFIASTVTKGEIESFVIQANWGVKRRKEL